MKQLLLSAATVLSLAVTALAAAPVNDNIASATVLSGDTPTASVDNTQATVETNDFAYHTVWWRWTAPANGRVTIDSNGSASPNLQMITYLRETSGTISGVVASDLNSGSTYFPHVTFPVTQGATYVFGLGTVNTTSAGVAQVNLKLNRTDPVGSLTIPWQATLANDSFAARQLLTDDAISHSVNAIGYNMSATNEGGDPSISAYRTLWWTFRPSTNGRLTVSTANSDSFLKTVMVYMGTGLANLSQISGDTSGDTITFPVTANTDYHISVGSNFTNTGSGYSGSIVLGLSLDTQADVSNLNVPFAATMANDTFAQRLILTGSAVAAIGYNLSATNEAAASEPSSSGFHTVWWTYRAPANGRVTVTTTGSDVFQKDVGVYLGNAFASLRTVASASNVNPVTLSFPVTANTDYQISVGSHFNSQTFHYGAIVLGIALDTQADVSFYNIPAQASAANDNYANRVVLNGGTVSAIGYNTIAAREALEPTGTHERTIWWDWTAPAAGSTVVDLTGSDAISKWATVWQGASLSSLVQVATSTQSNAPRVTFTAVAGQTYHIAVGNNSSSGAGSAGGNVVLTIGGPSGAAGGTVPSVVLDQAIHLRWFATAGLKYQVQKSPDLSTWTNVGPQITGAGTYQDYFDAISGPAFFYRIFLQ